MKWFDDQGISFNRYYTIRLGIMGYSCWTREKPFVRVGGVIPTMKQAKELCEQHALQAQER